MNVFDEYFYEMVFFCNSIEIEFYEKFFILILFEKEINKVIYRSIELVDVNLWMYIVKVVLLYDIVYGFFLLEEFFFNIEVNVFMILCK